MKRIILIIILPLIVSICTSLYIGNSNGQPQCDTEDELIRKKWANSFDPTHYWLCEKLGEPATDMNCSNGEAFDQNSTNCILWSDWQWKEPEDPDIYE